LVRIKEKRAALNDIRDRFLALKGQLGGSAEVQRLSRQLTGKLDLAIAAVDEQISALEQVGPGGFTLAEAANVITRPEGTISPPPSR
jgi:phosphoenolpyruvate carboxylase